MDRFKITQRVAAYGIGANIFLLVAKLTVGFISRSQAMIADGFNSAGDVFASAMTLIGNKISSRPNDEEHPYGHGKAEYIFSMIISFSLVLVAYRIFNSSLSSILNREHFTFSFWLAGIAILTIAIKLVLFLYTRNAGKKEHNILITSSAEDHRNDIFITSSTLLGIIMGNWGIYWVDGAVGIGISFWIAFTAYRIYKSSFDVLMDTNIDEEFKDELYRCVNSIEGVDHVDSINAKPIGVKFLIIVKVSVNGRLSIDEGHRIAAIIKEILKKDPNISDVIVHVNPA